MKKTLALCLCLVLALSLGGAVLAADLPEGWTPADGARGVIPEGWTPADGARELPEGWTAADGARDLPQAEVVDVPVGGSFVGVVTVDGVELDLTGIPGAPVGYLPMRAVCEAAGGLADYYAEDGEALFFLDDVRFIVNFTAMTVQVDFQPVDATVYLDPAGYTFLPVSLLNGQGQITVEDHPEMDSIRFDVKTSASDPTVALSNAILEACDMPAVTPVMDELLESLGFDMGNYTQLVAKAPLMNIKSATLFIAQVNEGKMDAAKADFKAFQDKMESDFEHYLADQYELAKAGQIVEAPDGQHLMLVISENNDKAVELFNAAYPAQ